mgnify:CR=1 FL=1
MELSLDTADVICVYIASHALILYKGKSIHPAQNLELVVIRDGGDRLGADLGAHADVDVLVALRAPERNLAGIKDPLNLIIVILGKMPPFRLQAPEAVALHDVQNADDLLRGLARAVDHLAHALADTPLQ